MAMEGTHVPMPSARRHEGGRGRPGVGRPVDEVQARGGRELVSHAKLTRSAQRGQEGLAKNREIEDPAGLVGQGKPRHWLNREER